MVALVLSLLGIVFQLCLAQQGTFPKYIQPAREYPGELYEYFEFKLPPQEWVPFEERDYDSVKKCIWEKILPIPRDGGHHGPMYMRWGFHMGGQFNRTTHLGGVSQAPARFTKGWLTRVDPFMECWQLLTICWKDHRWISYSDLWSLSAALSVEYSNGPKIDWRPGRVDVWYDLPQEGFNIKYEVGGPGFDAEPQVVMDYFTDQLGMTMQDAVAMMGGHCMGFGHGSFTTGVWTDDPFNFTNKFYQFLLEYEWVIDERYPRKQYTNLPGREYMYLRADMLHEVPEAVPYLHKFAKDEESFREAFAIAYNKNLEHGVVWEEVALTARGQQVTVS